MIGDPKYVCNRSKIVLDPLSDILALLKLRSYVAGGFDAGGDWAVAFGPYEGIKFHAVVAGRLWLAVDGVPDPVSVEAGDCFILTQGNPFRLASDLSLAPVDVARFSDRQRPGQIVTYNGGGSCRSIGGYCTLAKGPAALLLDTLPPVLMVKGGQARSVLRWCIERLHHELLEPQPGGDIMVRQMATMVIVEALRIQISTMSSDTNWLRALDDRQLYAAISSIHREPGRRWNLQSLAEEAALSRTVFATRFKKIVGQSPIEYLTRWRMELAADRLITTQDSVVTIGHQLGYESERAFGTAFRRVMNCPPRQYARRKLAGTLLHAQRARYSDTNSAN